MNPVSATAVVSSVGASILTKIAEGTILGFYSRLRRARRMQQAVQSGIFAPSKNKLEKQLIQAFGATGQLDQATQHILEDLSSSGLLGHIALFAVTISEEEIKARRKPLASRALFHLLVVARSPGSSWEHSNSLFDRLLRGIKAGLRTTKEPSREELTNLAAEADQQERFLAANLPSKSGQKTFEPRSFTKEQIEQLLSADQAERIRVALSRDQQQRHSYIDVQGPNSRRKPVEFDKLFVPTIIGAMSESFMTADRHSIQVTTPIKSAEFLENFDRAVVIGDPGGGKTTLARKFALDLARKGVDNTAAAPIFVQLRTYDAARARGQASSLIEFIVSDLSEACPDIDGRDLRTALHQFLLFGQVAVIFDGIDEVLSLPRRIEVRDQIDRFAMRYPLCRLLATARQVGYERAPLHAFAKFLVLPIEDTKRLYLSVAEHVIGLGKAEATKQAPTFLEDARRHASDLVGNPLMLSLIAILHASTRQIPDERAKLYEACAELMFESWDKDRGIDPQIPDQFRLRSLLSHLASRFYQDAELGGQMTRDQLFEFVKAYFLSDYLDNQQGRATTTASAFVEHLTNRVWVLQEVGNDHFEFTHRTFLEYFFAKALDEQFQTVEDLLSELHPHVRLGEWSVPSHLALQLKARDKRQIANKIARELIEWVRKAGQNDRSSVATFAAFATEYLQPNQDNLSAIAENVVLSVDEGFALKALESLFRTTSEMREAIFVGLGTGLSKLAESGSLYKVSPFIDALKSLILTGKIDRPSIELMLDQGFRDALSKHQGESAATAKVLFDLTGAISEKDANVFGLRLWADSLMPGEREDWRSDDFFLMFCECVEVIKDRPISLDQRPYARLAMLTANTIVYQARGSSVRIPPLRRRAESPFRVEELPVPPSFEQMKAAESNLVLGMYVAYVGLINLRRNKLSPKEKPTHTGMVECVESLKDPTARRFVTACFEGGAQIFSSYEYSEMKEPSSEYS